jgi:hypothetical protein
MTLALPLVSILLLYCRGTASLDAPSCHWIIVDDKHVSEKYVFLYGRTLTISIEQFLNHIIVKFFITPVSKAMK